jgi:hypothetical protein
MSHLSSAAAVRAEAYRVDTATKHGLRKIRPWRTSRPFLYGMEATELTKKVILNIVSICLVLCFSLVALADNKTVYIEYSREEGKDDFYPKVGFNWQINYNWGLAANHQFKVGEGSERKTYFEIRRAFLDRQLTLAFNGEISESYDSVGVSANAFSPLNDSLWYNGAVSYTTYSAKSNNPYSLDYSALKIFSGFQYKINDKLFTLIDGEWRNYQYVKNDTSLTSNPDYSEVQFSTGMVYHFTGNFFIKGVYNWKDTKYENSDSNKFGRGFIFTSYYTFNRYTYYLVYPFSQNDRTAVIGLSYVF